MKNLKNLLPALMAFCCGLLFAQEDVDINLNVKHIVDTTSVFDRSKYIVFHNDIYGGSWDSPMQQKSFLEDYDVYIGRNNGAIVWEYNNVREDPAKPGWPDLEHMTTKGNSSIASHANETFVHQFENRYKNMMIGGQEHMFPHGQTTSPPKNSGITPWKYSGYDAVAEFYVNYLTKYFGTGGTSGRPAPKMLEVINEPFVKAHKLGTTKLEMARYHNVVAKRVKQEYPDILVGGYTAAHPAFEDANFGHWNSNWKMFIDEAGTNMDFFSFHLYDYVGDVNNLEREAQRSGSNIEAIMDMINHYSVLKLGKVKPWSISEYGWFCPTCDGPYSKERDWFNIRSFSLMMMQLMERPDQILNAIPFVLLKAAWAKPADKEYNTYGPRLMREIGEIPGEPAHAGWVYTELIKFYQLWANVKGTRIDTKSSDQDLLTDAYVDGKKLYLILSNLEVEEYKVNLNIIDAGFNTIEGIMVKKSYEVGKLPKLDTNYYTENLTEIILPSEATIILEYTFAENIQLNETSTENTYFADKYLQQIKTSVPVSFNVNGVNKENYGEAILRLGLGRNHGLSLKPEVLVNGEAVKISSDWRGNKQKFRNSFFGVIEIPVPFDLLEKDNNISVKFRDNGGHISSVALQVFNFSKKIVRYGSITGTSEPQIAKSDFNIYPNPANDFVKIQSNNFSPVQYILFNLQGQELRAGQIANAHSELRIGDLHPGFYFLRFRAGNLDRTFKIIKQ